MRVPLLGQQTVQEYAQLLDQFAVQNHVPNYDGKETDLHGLTWGEIYLQLVSENPGVDPKTLADKVLGVEAVQKVSGGLAQGDTVLAPFFKGALAGPVAAVQHLIHDIPGVGTIDDLINWIKANFDTIMIRVGEVIVGVVLLYIGLKAIATPSGQQVGTRTVKHTAQSAAKVARKVVK